MRRPGRIRARAALVAALLLGAPAHGTAEWQFTPLIGYTFKGTTNLVDFETATDDRHWHLGGAVTLIGDGPIGVEGYYILTPGFFQSDQFIPVPEAADVTSSRTYALMGNVVLATPRAWNRYGLRPFVSGGVGRIHASYDERNVPARVNVLGMNIGGGAVGFVSDRVGLRFDLRLFRNMRGVGADAEDVPPTLPFDAPVRLRYWTASLGFVIKY